MKVFFCNSPSGIGRAVGWSRDLGISGVGEGIDEVLSIRGKGDSLLLDTLAAVLLSMEWPGKGLGLLQRGRLGLIMPVGQLPKETPNNEPLDFTYGRDMGGKNTRVREVHAEENPS